MVNMERRQGWLKTTLPYLKHIKITFNSEFIIWVFLTTENANNFCAFSGTINNNFKNL